MPEPIIVLLHTAENRGDHYADVTFLFTFDETAALSDVIKKLRPTSSDWIEIPAIGSGRHA